MYILLLFGGLLVFFLVFIVVDYFVQKKADQLGEGMTDFQISRSERLDSRRRLYYDEHRRTVRLAHLTKGEDSYIDIEDVDLGALFTSKTEGTIPICIVAEDICKERLILTDADHYKVIENATINNRIQTERACVIFDYKHNQLITITDYNSSHVIPFDDIVKVELLEDGDLIASKSLGRTIGGAIVGNALAGGAGMIVGGLSGDSKSIKKVRQMDIKLLVDNYQKASISIPVFYDQNKTKSDSSKYRNYLKTAQDIIDEISIVLERNHKEEIKTENAGISSIGSVADEIAKLASLKEQGLITEEEFGKMKEKLMS